MDALGMMGRMQPQAGDLLKLDWGDGHTDLATVLAADTSTRRLQVRYARDGEVLAMNMGSTSTMAALRQPSD